MKKYFSKLLIFLLLSSSLLTACTVPDFTIGLQPTIQAPSGSLLAVFPELKNLTNANVIRIEDNYGGWESHVNHYYLYRNGSQFEGEHFARQGYSLGPKEKIYQASISTDKAKQFLQALIQVPVQEAYYEPKITHTDDYPSLSIQVESEVGLLQVLSQSQGNDHVPWGANFKGRTFVINSSLPARAMYDFVAKIEKKEVPKPYSATSVVTTTLLFSATNQLKETANYGNPLNHRVLAMAFSPDNQTYATIGTLEYLNYSIQLWNRNGEHIKSFKFEGDYFFNLFFSPDGTKLAASNEDMFVWDIKTGQEIARYKPNQYYSDNPPIFTTDWKKLIALVGTRENTTINVLDLTDNNKVLATTPGNEAAVHPDNKTLAVIDAAKGEFKLWNSETDQTTVLAQLGTYNNNLLATIDNMAFSPDGKTLVASYQDYKTSKLSLVFWDVPTAKKAKIIDMPKAKYLRDLTFSPDGKWLASLVTPSDIALWEVESNKQTLINQFPLGILRSIAFSPDSKILVSVGSNLQFWDLSNLTLMRTQDNLHAQAFALSPDAITLALSTEPGSIRLHNTSDGKETSVWTAHLNAINTLAYSPDGKILASGGSEIANYQDHNPFNTPNEDNVVKLWDASSHKLLATLSGHHKAVRSIAFRPDGKLLASASDDRTVILWEIPSGRKLATLKGKVPEFFAFAALSFSPDGKTLAVGGEGDKTNNYYPIKLWDVDSNREIGQLVGANGPIKSLVFSPDGKTLAAGGTNFSYSKDNYVEQLIWLWSVETKKQDVIMQAGQPHSVATLSFSPDGKTLLSSHTNGSLNLWESSTGKLISTTPVTNTKTSNLLLATFMLDGKTVIGTSDDGSIKKWQITK